MSDGGDFFAWWSRSSGAAGRRSAPLARLLTARRAWPQHRVHTAWTHCFTLLAGVLFVFSASPAWKRSLWFLGWRQRERQNSKLIDLPRSIQPNDLYNALGGIFFIFSSDGLVHHEICNDQRLGSCLVGLRAMYSRNFSLSYSAACEKARIIFLSYTKGGRWLVFVNFSLFWAYKVFSDHHNTRISLRNLNKQRFVTWIKDQK